MPCHQREVLQVRRVVACFDADFVCVCSRDVVEKAALLDKMVATRKDMMLKGQSMDVAKMLDESTEVLSLNEY